MGLFQRFAAFCGAMLLVGPAAAQVIQYSSIHALQTGSATAATVYVGSYYDTSTASADRGGGAFQRIYPTPSCPENGGTIIASGSACYMRQFEGQALDFSWFGASLSSQTTNIPKSGGLAHCGGLKLGGQLI
jgi:hypothetical protein